MSHDAMPPTRIRATCPGCGEVELTPPDVELRVCQQEQHSFYAFVCPGVPPDRDQAGRPAGGAAADLWWPRFQAACRRAARPGRIRRPSAHAPEVALPLWLAILLGVFWLAVLVCVAFTVWRMVANLKALAASVQALSERLTPALEELSTASQEAADHAARLSEREASAAEQR
jgi:hypothetical protein